MQQVDTAKIINLSDQETARAAQIAPLLRMLDNGATARASVVSFRWNDRKSRAEDGAQVMRMAGEEPLKGQFDAFVARTGMPPAIILLEDLGFALGTCMEDALSALRVFLGGTACAAPCASPVRRLDRKIALVTGGAQGFGLGIAKHLADLGAYVALADINLAGAQAQAQLLCAQYGPCAAIALSMDVTQEAQVRAGVDRVVAVYGGLDVLVSNAGVLRAGALDQLSLDDFMYVTNVNYVGYFLCAKHAARIMKLQNSIDPAYWMDIVQINSKSGLTGSNKNCSYSGSKFGGVGLTQSFAMELAEFSIKVNAICPGNFLNGPLWSDPVDGLFVQYLRAGKIKDAKTVEDLVRYYNAKVPMRRSCEAEDVAKAVVYVIEQDYETGQAMPVSGGQLMLK